MSTSKQIKVVAFQTFEDYEQHRGCVVDYEYDTVKQAKDRAKYMLTDRYQAAAEAAEPLRYAQVTVGGEVRHDFFRKEGK